MVLFELSCFIYFELSYFVVFACVLLAAAEPGRDFTVGASPGSFVELSNLASWMPTKKYLQARVRQLKEELECAKESIRESSVEGASEAESETSEQDLEEMARERVRELQALNTALEVRVTAAETEQKRWLEREQRWVLKEEKLEQRIQ